MIVASFHFVSRGGSRHSKAVKRNDDDDDALAFEYLYVYMVMYALVQPFFF